MSLTKVSYSMIAGAPVMVDDFIPAGTNTQTTDCHTYIQLAINSMPTTASGVRGHLCFANKRYNIGTPSGATPAILVDRAMIISGNGATLVAEAAATGRVLRVNSPFVTLQDIEITKVSFPLTSTADLTGEALNMLSTATVPCQKWQLSNVQIVGFQYGMTFSGEGAGCAYGDIYSPRIRFTAYGMIFDSTDLPASYITNINVFGGELSIDGFGAYTNSRGIWVRNTNSNHATNGINFYGTNLEGSWIRKVICEGQSCSFNNLYWDNTNGGTDIEFVDNGSGQVSKDNMIVGGSPLWIQVIANTSGQANTVIDPTKGLAFGNPVLTTATAFSFSQLSAGGGGVQANVANNAAPAVNNAVTFQLQAKKADGTLVPMAGLSGRTVDPAVNGKGIVGLSARNSGGYAYPVMYGEGETGNVYPGVTDVADLGTQTYKWRRGETLQGYVVTTPDLSKRYLIAVNNAGAVTSTLL